MSRTNLWSRLSQLAAPSRRPSAPKFALRPAVEGLEDRKLMAVVTDLADAVLQVGHTHAGTHLYINFDGGTAPTDFSGTNFVTIRSFETEAGDGALNRDRDIQDILFQVAEVYSPFDVQVERIFGSGAYSTDSGNTTVFVGGNSANTNFAFDAGGVTNYTYTKYLAGFTPAAFADGQTVNQEINTHPYDVAFVDPVAGVATDVAKVIQSYSTETQAGDPTRANIFDIRRSIAHEAGHTFGLDHVRTDGLPDPTAIGTGRVNDVQAYDASNVFFANQRLPLSTVNNSPKGNVFNQTLPAYIDPATSLPVTLVTENSYQTLGRVLGYRTQSGLYSQVADTSTVDPIAQRNVQDASNLSQYDGYIGHNGDHQVVRYTPAPYSVGQAYDRITVHATFGGLRPEILVYDASGVNLISVVKASGSTATLTNIKAGATFTLVFGAANGSTTGAYSVTIEHKSLILVSQVSQIHNPAAQAFLALAGRTGIAKAISSVGHKAVAKLPVDTTGESLDIERIGRLPALAQIQVATDESDSIQNDQPPATAVVFPAPAPAKNSKAHPSKKTKRVVHTPFAKMPLIGHVHPGGPLAKLFVR